MGRIDTNERLPLAGVGAATRDEHETTEMGVIWPNNSATVGSGPNVGEETLPYRPSRAGKCSTSSQCGDCTIVRRALTRGGCVSFTHQSMSA